MTSPPPWNSPWTGNVNLVVLNQTANKLEVCGHTGSDLIKLQLGQPIPANGQLQVAVFTNSSSTNYDWVYLFDTVTATYYQIYVEITDENVPYVSFAYYDPNSKESKNDPTRFVDGDSLVWWDGVNSQWNYVLLNTPVAIPNQQTPPNS
jgi:hypothetical protein